MTYERAAEILDPEHRETYESLEIVNEACRMGRAALFRRMPEPPHPDGDESILACPTCGSGEYLCNEDGNRCCFCGWCGQAIDWNAETFKTAGQMKPVLKYPGSKWRLAEWIVSLMPPHKSYLEPFFGSGAVFFKKPPSRIETINDLDGEIINLFRCIREQPEELMRAVAYTPYSRGEYEQAWDHFKAGGQVRPDGIEAARLTLVRYWQAHGSTVVYKGGWKNDRAGREYAYDVRYWRQLPERIAAVVERLKDAQIEQVPAVDVIRRFRHPDVLIYQTAEQVQAAIAASGHAHFEVAETDPTAEGFEAQTNVMYLYMNSKTKHYDIYAKVGESVVLLDDTTVDLSEYAKTADVTSAISTAIAALNIDQYATDDDLTAAVERVTALETAIANVYTKKEVDDKLATKMDKADMETYATDEEAKQAAANAVAGAQASDTEFNAAMNEVWTPTEG